MFAGAFLLLSGCYPYREPSGRFALSLVDAHRLRGLSGNAGQLGCPAVIVWLKGLGPGIVAFLLVPIVASMIYGLAVHTLLKSRWAKTRCPPQLVRVTAVRFSIAIDTQSESGPNQSSPRDLL